MHKKNRRGDIIRAYFNRPHKDDPFKDIRLIARQLKVSPSYVSKTIHRYLGSISEKELSIIINRFPIFKTTLAKLLNPNDCAETIDKSLFNKYGPKRNKIWNALIDNGYLGDNGEVLDRFKEEAKKEEFLFDIGDFVEIKAKDEIVKICRQPLYSVISKLGKKHYQARRNYRILLERLIKSDAYSSYSRDLYGLLLFLKKKTALTCFIDINKVEMGRKSSLSASDTNKLIVKMKRKPPNYYEISADTWSAASFRKLISIIFPHIVLQPRRFQQIFNERIKPHLV